MAFKPTELVKSINAWVTFGGLVMAAFTYVWSHYFSHLQNVEVFVLCAGMLAFTTWILYYGTIFYKKLVPKKVKKIFNKKFENQTIELDNCEFYGCEFENITFHYRGGLWRFENCILPRQSLKIKYLADEANNTQNLVHFIWGWQKELEKKGIKIEAGTGYLDSEEQKKSF